MAPWPFWLAGLRTGKKRYFAAAGILGALGLYTYHGYKVFLVLALACGVYEGWKHRATARKQWKAWALMAALFLMAAAPLLAHWVRQGTVGSYEMSLFIGRQVAQERSLMPLLQSAAQTFLIFNREGDPFALHNFQSHRMLDDFTGLLWVLGLALALSRRGERKYFYALAGLGILSLNSFLTVESVNANRMLATMPFVAFLAASAFQTLVSAWRKVGWKKPAGLALSVALGAAVAFQNFHQYFGLQVQDPLSFLEFDAVATDVGTRIASDAQTQYYLPFRYGYHYTIRFLDYFHGDDYRNWDWPKDLALAEVPPGKKSVCFVLREGEEGILRLLESLYPACQTETVRDRQGVPMIFYARIPADPFLDSRGLEMIPASGPKRSCPNFPEDLPKGPFRGSLAGRMFLQQSGNHRFWAKDAARKPPGKWMGKASETRAPFSWSGAFTT